MAGKRDHVSHLVQGFLSDLLSLLGCLGGSGAASLDGTLKLKYHTFPFARTTPDWRISSPLEKRMLALWVLRLLGIQWEVWVF